LATAFPYEQRERRNFYLTFWEASMMRTQGVRHTGSAVLDLYYVACGRVDAFLEFGPRPWDVAAGVLIVTEAGGRVTNLDGSPLGLDARKILTSKGKLHRTMRETIAKAWPEADRARSRGSRRPITRPSLPATNR
jgi:myo-inositol-1(or 4)-monophosphatase